MIGATAEKSSFRAEDLLDKRFTSADASIHHHGISGDISGRELEDLLYPVAPETFFAEYWGRKPLFIKGDPDKLRRLFPGGFSVLDCHNAVGQTAAGKDENVRVWSQTLTPVGNGMPFDITSIRPDEMETVVATGLNVACENIKDRRLAKFAAAIKAQLNYPCNIGLNCTISPEGNGWPLHVDRSSTFNIQCEGKKRFLVSLAGPAVEWPCGSISFKDDGVVDSHVYENEDWDQVNEPVDTSNLNEAIMEPGDVLYWPAGTLHATKALSTTCNIVVSIESESFLDLLNRALESILEPNPAWRHLPTSKNPKPGELPAEAADFFAERLSELRQVIERFEADPSELNRQWQKSASNPGEEILSQLAVDSTQSNNNKPVGKRDVLRLSRKAPINFAMGRDREGEATLEVYFAGKEFETSGEWVPFLKTMLTQESFAAASAMGWAGEGKRYPWEPVREYLDALLAEGFLERIDPRRRGYA